MSCGRGFPGCRSRDGGHRFPRPGAPAFRNAADAHPGRSAGGRHAGQSRVLGPHLRRHAGEAKGADAGRPEYLLPRPDRCGRTRRGELRRRDAVLRRLHADSGQPAGR